METQAVRIPLSQLSERLKFSKPVREALERYAKDPIHDLSFTAPEGELSHLGIRLEDPNGKLAPIVDTVDLKTASNPGIAVLVETNHLSNQYIDRYSQDRYSQLLNQGSTIA